MDSIVPVQVTLNKINFSIDPRIELLASIQLISDYGDFVPVIIKKDFTYKRKMKEYFESFKEHKAVKLFKEYAIYTKFNKFYDDNREYYRNMMEKKLVIGR